MDNIHPNVEVWFNSNVYFLRLLFIYIFTREKICNKPFTYYLRNVFILGRNGKLKFEEVMRVKIGSLHFLFT